LVRGATLAMLLVALCFSEVVVFLCFAGALTAAEAEWEGRLSARRAAAGVLVCAAAVLVATRLLAFFAPSPDRAALGLASRHGVAGLGRETLLWHAVSLGLLLPLGAAGLARVRTERWLLAFLAAGSLCSLNFVKYRFSWDMAKFGVVASLSLAVPAAEVLWHLWTARRRRLGRGLALLALASSLAGALFLTVLLTAHPPLRWLAKSLPQLTDDDARAVDWLRARWAPPQVVWRVGPTAPAYAVWGGLPQAGIDEMVAAHGFAPERIARRERVLSASPPDPAPLRREGIAWIVVGPGDDEVARLVAQWAALGYTTRAATFGGVQVYRWTSTSSP